MGKQSPSLLQKVNFRRGWPNPHVLEDVLPADPTAGDSTPLLEGGFLVVRSFGDPDYWKLVDCDDDADPSQKIYVLRNDQLDPDAAREGVAQTMNVQVPFGGIQGVHFGPGIEIETVQWDTEQDIAPGDKLYQGEDGLLRKVEAPASPGTVEKLCVAVCIKGPTIIGQHTYITVQSIGPVGELVEEETQ